ALLGARDRRGEGLQLLRGRPFGADLGDLDALPVVLHHHLGEHHVIGVHRRLSGSARAAGGHEQQRQGGQPARHHPGSVLAHRRSPGACGKKPSQVWAYPPDPSSGHQCRPGLSTCPPNGPSPAFRHPARVAYSDPYGGLISCQPQVWTCPSAVRCICWHFSSLVTGFSRNVSYPCTTMSARVPAGPRNRFLISMRPSRTRTHASSWTPSPASVHGLHRSPAPCPAATTVVVGGGGSPAQLRPASIPPRKEITATVAAAIAAVMSGTVLRSTGR